MIGFTSSMNTTRSGCSSAPSGSCTALSNRTRRRETHELLPRRTDATLVDQLANRG